MKYILYYYNMNKDKICKTCYESKPINDFYTNLNECKKCHNKKYYEYKKQWEKNKRKKNREIINKEKEKKLELLRLEKQNIKLHKAQEKKRIKEEHLKKVREEKKRIREEYLKSDEYKEKIRLKNLRKYNRRMSSNPLYKFKKLLSNSIRKSFRKKGFSKSSKTQQILGAKWEIIKEYFESRFEVGMSWDNYGKWHIDHILPISTATCEEDVIRLNHYTNLQPMWAKDNLKKSNSITTEGRIKQIFPYDIVTKNYNS